MKTLYMISITIWTDVSENLLDMVYKLKHARQMKQA